MARAEESVTNEPAVATPVSAAPQTYSITGATAPESLPGHGAAAIAQGKGSYSSLPFVTPANDRNVFLEVQLAEARDINKVILRAELEGGKPVAFPAEYRLEYLTSDGSWAEVGSFFAAPAADGTLSLGLPKVYRARALRLYPTQLGQNTEGSYYFQLAAFTPGFDETLPVGGATALPAASGFMNTPADSRIFSYSGRNYCERLGPDDFLNAGGKWEEVSLVASALVQGMHFDGPCAPAKVPEGYFALPGDPKVYRSNGVNAYCSFASREEFASRRNLASAAEIREFLEAKFPAGFQDEGPCAP